MRILILGQTPPPYGGQAINIGKMLDALSGSGISYRLIRLNFSDEINQMGDLTLKKLLRLAGIFFRLLWSLLFYRPAYVYYPPAGARRTPVFRDMVLLFPVRLFRFKTIFHYHAGGLSSLYTTLSPALRWLYRFAYFHATHSICLSEYGKTDPVFLQSEHIHIISSGVGDAGYHIRQPAGSRFTVLFAGLCSESKGVLDFIQVIRKARKNHAGITGCILGKTYSGKERRLIRQAEDEGLLHYKGVQTGESKHAFFRDADVFLFPSSFESENFPTVILEAFSAGLPVIATEWRGIPDQVHDGYNGFLHKPHDIDRMAASVVTLANDRALYASMARHARHDFETKYRMDIFDASIIHFFKSLK